MRRLLVFQHVPFEILGTLDPLLKSQGFRIRYVNFGRDPDARPRLAGYDGIIILGGPMSVDDVECYPNLATEIELICEALAASIPMLGICLGAQLIARALRAEVGPGPCKEIGWCDVSPTEAGATDPVLGHFRASEKIFQWHGDVFEIPNGAVCLASSPTCPNQAFRYRDNVYGFQFHLEVDERLIDRWLTVPVHVEELVQLHGTISPGRIRRETRDHIRRLRRLSDRSFGEFLEIVERRSLA